MRQALYDRQPAGFLVAQMRIEQQLVGKGAARERVTAIIGVAAVQEDLPPDRAIEQPGIEMRQAEMFGQRLRNGALARGSRSVDGDNHRACLRPRTALAKPHTAIAAQNPSSTRLGQLV